MTNQPTSSSQLTENKQSDEDTTINLPTSLLTETSLREICKTLRLDQTGSRVACLDRIKSKLKESNGHDNKTKKSKQCDLSETIGSSRHSSLSSMPIEIKAIIVYWVYHLPSSHEKYQPRNTLIIHSSHVHEWVSNSTTADYLPRPRRKRFQKQGDSLPLKDIRSLASIDRSFYQICRPYLYEWLNFLGGDMRIIALAYQDIIPRHAQYVKKIWWRISFSEMCSYEDKMCKDIQEEDWQSTWDPIRRSQLLLDILLACPRITNLDIDIDMPEDLSPIVNSPSNSPTDGHEMMYKFIKPISQLTSLTHLSLTVPIGQESFSEDSLVEIISELSQLQSFACSNIDSTRSETTRDSDHQSCQSPLGVHLASLSHLTRLSLRDVRCFDARWNQLKWHSSLEELTMIECHRVTVSEFHAFTKLFASTLVKLETKNVPWDPTWFMNPHILDPSGQLLQFELPKLHTLKTSIYLPIEFLRIFQASTNLSTLLLDTTPLLGSQDLLGLIADNVWPNLQRFEITHRTAAAATPFLSWTDIKNLEILCQGREIEMNFNSEYDYDYDEEMWRQQEEEELNETD